MKWFNIKAALGRVEGCAASHLHPGLCHTCPCCRVRHEVRLVRMSLSKEQRINFLLDFPQFAQGYTLVLADRCSVLHCCSVNVLPWNPYKKKFVLFVFLTEIHSEKDAGNSPGKLYYLCLRTWEPGNSMFISLTSEFAWERACGVERWQFIFPFRVSQWMAQQHDSQT